MAEFAGIISGASKNIVGSLTEIGGALFTGCGEYASDMEEAVFATSSDDYWQFTRDNKTVNLKPLLEVDKHVSFTSAVVSYIGVTPEFVKLGNAKISDSGEVGTRKITSMQTLDYLAEQLKVTLLEKYTNGKEGKKIKAKLVKETEQAFNEIKKANGKKAKALRLSSKQLATKKNELMLECDAQYFTVCKKWVNSNYGEIMTQESRLSGRKGTGKEAVLSKLAEYDTVELAKSVTICTAFPFRVEYDVLKISQEDAKQRIQTLKDQLEEKVTEAAAKLKTELLEDQRLKTKILSLGAQEQGMVAVEGLKSATGLNEIDKAFAEFAKEHPEHSIEAKGRLAAISREEKTDLRDIDNLEKELAKWYEDRVISSFTIAPAATYGHFDKGVGFWTGAGINAELKVKVAPLHTDGDADYVRVNFEQADKRNVPIKGIKDPIRTGQVGSVTFYPTGGIATTGVIGDFVGANNSGG